MPLGREIDLVGHSFVKVDNLDLSNIPDVTNIVILTEKPEFKWIEETSRKIGYWRAYFQSAYIRWALSINGLHVASQRYESKDWKNNIFYVKSLRMNDKSIEEFIITEWDGKKAAKAHLDTVKMLNGWGFIDLCGCMEEFIFDFYKIYLLHNPEPLFKGKEYKWLKKLYKASQTDPIKKEEWDIQICKRLESWQRKKLYDGLSRVFLSYCNEANIKRPSEYKYTDPTTWAESIEGIFFVRNALMHGQKKVTKEIEDFGKKPYSLALKFKENDDLEISLIHLQSLELFTHQLLTALNLSLLDKYNKQ